MAVGSWLYDEDTLKGVLPVGVLVYYLACYDIVYLLAVGWGTGVYKAVRVVYLEP